MRLKQLLVTFVVASFSCVMAAADSQMTAVNVDSIDNASTVSIRANGPFVHNEYRPSESLLLVDLAGVSIGKLDNNLHAVNLPGLTSYRVMSYTGMQGNQVARVEIALQPHTTIHLQDQSNGLLIKVTGGVAVTTAVSVPARPDGSSEASAPAAPASTNNTAARTALPDAAPIFNGKPAKVQGISVVRSKDGMNVEIHAAGVSNLRALKLTSPERIVVDLPNAVAVSSSRQVPVHSPDIKTVRMSQFQANPPITRVVVDVASPQGYEIVNSGSMVMLKLHPLNEQAAEKSAVKSEVSAQPKAVAVSAKESSAKPAGKLVAQDLVFVEPTYKPKDPNQDKTDSASQTPAERAAVAASRFGAAPPVDIPLSSTPANADIRPSTVNAAFMQVVSPGQGPSQLQPGAVQGIQGMAQQAVQQSNQGAPAPSGGTGMTSAQGTGANLPSGGRGVIGCVTGRYTGEPISVNLKDVDLKDFFRLIHEISGLNVVLDPGVAGSLTLVLDDVPWDQALSIVLNNNGLECQIEGNVLRIALPSTIKREADARRAAIEAQALAVDKTTVTRYLSYAAAKDVVPTIKQFLSQRGDIIADERTNGLIISDIPSVIPNVDRLLRELDRKTPEVEIEARVVAATRNYARDLGTQVGVGWGNSPTAVGGTTEVGTSVIQNNAPNVQNPAYFIVGSHQIPLFTNMPAIAPSSGLSILNATNHYRLDLILTAAESRGLLKILSRPRVVTQNNIQAIVRQGVRIPVVTLAQLGGPPTVQYVDAFLRLQVRPQITAEGTIFLNVDVENTTPDFGRQVQGNPTLVTQQATTQVLVTDGGTVVIGGVIQTQNAINYQQVPYLGSVPVLGNLFKRKAVSTSTQELIFFLTPKIIQT